jgi:hypothetical protein
MNHNMQSKQRQQQPRQLQQQHHHQHQHQQQHKELEFDAAELHDGDSINSSTSVYCLISRPFAASEKTKATSWVTVVSTLLCCLSCFTLCSWLFSTATMSQVNGTDRTASEKAKATSQVN